MRFPKYWRESRQNRIHASTGISRTHRTASRTTPKMLAPSTDGIQNQSTARGMAFPQTTPTSGIQNQSREWRNRFPQSNAVPGRGGRFRDAGWRGAARKEIRYLPRGVNLEDRTKRLAPFGDHAGCQTARNGKLEDWVSGPSVPERTFQLSALSIHAYLHLHIYILYIYIPGIWNQSQGTLTRPWLQKQIGLSARIKLEVIGCYSLFRIGFSGLG